MFFAAICTDKPDHLQKRLENRPQHLAYLGSLKEKLKVAGALLGPDNQTPVGSLMIYDVADEKEAQAIAAADPFTQAGLFATVEVKAWRQGFGAPLA